MLGDSCSILGIHVSYAELFHDAEVIPVTQFDAPLALIPIHSDAIDKDLWITISLDRVNVVLSLNIIY